MRFDYNENFVNEYKQSPGVANVVTEIAEEVHDVFSMIAPQDTGRMVATSHTALNLEADGWVGYMLVPVFYAKFVEWGTQYMRAQYNMRIALEHVCGG